MLRDTLYRRDKKKKFRKSGNEKANELLRHPLRSSLYSKFDRKIIERSYDENLLIDR